LKESGIVTIYKKSINKIRLIYEKGNETECTDYRGLSLLPTT